jgi:hypothetical protein
VTLPSARIAADVRASLDLQFPLHSVDIELTEPEYVAAGSLVRADPDERLDHLDETLCLVAHPCLFASPSRLGMAAGHTKIRITGRVGNVRATSQKPAATNIAMVPV